MVFPEGRCRADDEREGAGEERVVLRGREGACWHRWGDLICYRLQELL